MRIYIGKRMYEVNKETVLAAKKISSKMLESTKEICETSSGGLYLYLATLVTLKMMAERTLTNMSQEKLDELFGEAVDPDK